MPRSRRRNRSAASTANRPTHCAPPARPSCSRRSGHNPRCGTTWRLETYNDLDTAPPVLERLAPALERHAARDQALEPALVRTRERLRRQLVVSAVGVDGAEHDGVVQNQGAIEAADIELKPLPRLGDSGQADDAGRARCAEAAADHGRSTGAFHQHVGSEPPEALRVAVID